MLEGFNLKTIPGKLNLCVLKLFAFSCMCFVLAYDCLVVIFYFSVKAYDERKRNKLHYKIKPSRVIHIGITLSNYTMRFY